MSIINVLSKKKNSPCFEHKIEPMTTIDLWPPGNEKPVGWNIKKYMGQEMLPYYICKTANVVF